MSAQFWELPGTSDSTLLPSTLYYVMSNIKVIEQDTGRTLIHLVIYLLTPPITETVRTPRGRPNFVASSSIWEDQKEKSLH